MADWVVIRPAERVPVACGDTQYLPPVMNGRWFDLAAHPEVLHDGRLAVTGYLEAQPTAQLETREDGAVAQVWRAYPATPHQVTCRLPHPHA